MGRTQTTSTSARSRSDRDLVGAIFAALAAASTFVAVEPVTATGPARFDAGRHPVPRFRGWIHQ
ncbi:MAG: hypothetical protein M3171_07995 [Actinomycetota bacterium]|nr:hypothetical protein [Actinomycetota bacterium]